MSIDTRAVQNLRTQQDLCFYSIQRFIHSFPVFHRFIVLFGRLRQAPIHYLKYEVLTAVKMSIMVFWIPGFLQNIDNHLKDYTAPQRITQSTSYKIFITCKFFV
jgi:hypothetical protein